MARKNINYEGRAIELTESIRNGNCGSVVDSLIKDYNKRELAVMAVMVSNLLSNNYASTFLAILKDRADGHFTCRVKKAVAAILDTQEGAKNFP